MSQTQENNIHSGIDFTGETQITRYISNGSQDQEYEPRFVYFGFQYAEVEGLKARLAARAHKHFARSVISITLFSYSGAFPAE